MPRDWPPDYAAVIRWRNEQLLRFAAQPWLITAAKEYYKEHPIEFIEHWCVTVDPRNAGRSGKLVKMPFILFKRQREFITFLHQCLKAQESGLCEKSRDMGATWLAAAFSVWLWLFYPGAAIGWGSRKEDLVDNNKGDMNSIFEKMRAIITNLPIEFLPTNFTIDNMTHMKIINPETGASITGESGDNIGRGGRTLVYFKDEAAWYERPELIAAALGENTRVQIDISSVAGTGNVFYNRRQHGADWNGHIVPGKVQVFVFDWRDHPEKDDAWYKRRKDEYENDGLPHKFAQEVDRDYTAAVEGIVIPGAWVNSAVDVHLLLPDYGAWRGGGYSASLDVADGGGDRNSLCVSEGSVVLRSDEWGEVDTGATTRRAIAAITALAPVDLQYDCIGVGAGVKAEANRLRDEKVMPRGIRLIPWDAGSSPLRPDKRVVEGDGKSPLNKEFYANLKAQGWWELRWRFERTHKLVTAYKTKEPLPRYDVTTLISLSSSMGVGNLSGLKQELSQVIRRAPTGRMKLVIDKNPPGTRSPNRADAVMMDFWPVRTYDTSNRWVA